jgi:hypothetical protein
MAAGTPTRLYSSERRLALIGSYREPSAVLGAGLERRTSRVREGALGISTRSTQACTAMRELPTGTVTFLFADIEGNGLCVCRHRPRARLLGRAALTPEHSARPTCRDLRDLRHARSVEQAAVIFGADSTPSISPCAAKRLEGAPTEKARAA